MLFSNIVELLSFQEKLDLQLKSLVPDTSILDDPQTLSRIVNEVSAVCVIGYTCIGA